MFRTLSKRPPPLLVCRVRFSPPLFAKPAIRKHTILFTIATKPPSFTVQIRSLKVCFLGQVLTSPKWVLASSRIKLGYFPFDLQKRSRERVSVPSVRWWKEKAVLSPSAGRHPLLSCVNGKIRRVWTLPVFKTDKLKANPSYLFHSI